MGLYQHRKLPFLDMTSEAMNAMNGLIEKSCVNIGQVFASFKIILKKLSKVRYNYLQLKAL